MTETEFRTKVCKLLTPLHAFKVENLLNSERGLGTPDVCCTHGWIELKLTERPARETTRVTIDMRPSQRIWHRNWRAAGGRSWTLTLVDGVDWLLHDGHWAAEHLGVVAMNRLEDASDERRWTTRPIDPITRWKQLSSKNLMLGVMSRQDAVR